MSNGIKVNTETVKIQIDELDNISTTLTKFLNRVETIENQYNDNTLNFGGVKKLLNKRIKGCQSIINKCEKYIEIWNKKILDVYSVTNNMSKNSILDLGKGPINPSFLENSESLLAKSKASSDSLSNDEVEIIKNIGQDSEETLQSILTSSDYLTDEDKVYVQKQLDKGNTRAAMSYILIKQAEQDVELLQNALSEANNRKFAALNDYYTENPNEDGGFEIPSNIAAEISQLNSELNAKNRQINQYKNSNKEWQYDCYFNLIGTEDFENKIAIIDLYRLAREYYLQDSQMDKFGYNIANSLSIISLMINDSEDDSFIKWLQSDKCTLENKDKLISCFNQEYQGKEAIDIFDKYDSFLGRVIELSEMYTITESQLKVYEYIYLTEGKEAAEQYIVDFEQTLNMQRGLSKAIEILESIVSSENNSALQGFLDANWNGIKLGTQEWFERVGTLFDKNGIMTSAEYTMMYINSLLSGANLLSIVSKNDLANIELDSEKRKKLEERMDNGEQILYLDIALAKGEINEFGYNNLKELLNNEIIVAFINYINESGFLGISHSEWLNGSFKVGVGVGTMIPSITTALVTGGVVGTTSIGANVVNIGKNAMTISQFSGSLAGLSTMFLYCASYNKAEALRDGRSLSQAWTYAILSATGEAVSEFYLGYVPFISKGLKWAASGGSSAIKKLGKILLSFFALRPLQEIAQEEFEDNIWRPFSQIVSFGESDYKFSLANFIDTAITTYFTTLELQILTIQIPDFNKKIKRSDTAAIIELDGKNIELTYGDLIDCTIDGKPVEARLADIVQRKITGSTDISQHGTINDETYNILKNSGKILQELIGPDGTHHIIMEDGFDFPYKPSHQNSDVNLENNSISELASSDKGNPNTNPIKGLNPNEGENSNSGNNPNKGTNSSDGTLGQETGSIPQAEQTSRKRSTVMVKEKERPLEFRLKLTEEEYNALLSSNDISSNTINPDGSHKIVYKDGISTIIEIDNSVNSIDETLGQETSSIPQAEQTSREGTTTSSQYTASSKEGTNPNTNKTQGTEQTSKEETTTSSQYTASSKEGLSPSTSKTEGAEQTSKEETTKAVKGQVTMPKIPNPKINPTPAPTPAPNPKPNTSQVVKNELGVEPAVKGQVTVPESIPKPKIDLNPKINPKPAPNPAPNPPVNPPVNPPENPPVDPPENPPENPPVNPPVDPPVDPPNDNTHKPNYIWPYIIALPAIIAVIYGLSSNPSKLTLELLGNVVMEIYQNTPYEEPGYIAKDTVDGDLTKKVVVTGKVDSNVIGTYVLNYSVTNSQNITATRERTVYVIEKKEDKVDTSRFIIKEFHSIPKKYKLQNNKRDSLYQLTNQLLQEEKLSKVTAIGVDFNADGEHYSSLSSCDDTILNKEASLISIYKNKVLSTYHDSSCYNDRGIFYATRIGELEIRNVITNEQYNNVVNANPRDTFIYDQIILKNKTAYNNSNVRSNNIAICTTGKKYKVFIPKTNVKYSEYTKVLKSEGCINAVTVLGNRYEEYKENGKISSNGYNQTYDSLIYFE